MPAPRVRSIGADDVEAWMGVVRTAMLGQPPVPEMVEARQKSWDLDRCLAAIDDDGRICGTARDFATELTVPGGTVAAAAVSAVGVLPTHRRRGYLTEMMQVQLAGVAQRGEPVAILVAAEYPIYGRFGYGMAVEACDISLDALTGDDWRDPASGTVSLADNDAFRGELVALYDRARLRSPGHIVYDDEEWDDLVGVLCWNPEQGERRRNAPKVLWRDGDGVVQGAAVYTVDSHWDQNRPRGELRADLVVAATDEAEREVVRYLASVDWVARVRLGLRPIDDPLPFWLRDGRAAVLGDRSDHIWARIVDVPAALAARRYATPGRLVLEVADPLGHAAGRFRLDVDGEGVATCEPVSDAADLAVAVDVLGAAYLGGTSWARLDAAGRVDERRAGAVNQAATLFSTVRAPWCALSF